MLTQIESVLLFVQDIHAAAKWYGDILSLKVEYENEHYAFIKGPQIILGFHPADEKNNAGQNGSVTYWKVENLEKALTTLREKGATLYRGPMTTTLSANVAMMTDPFGNQFGLNESPKIKATA